MYKTMKLILTSTYNGT